MAIADTSSCHVLKAGAQPGNGPPRQRSVFLKSGHLLGTGSLRSGQNRQPAILSAAGRRSNRPGLSRDGDDPGSTMDGPSAVVSGMQSPRVDSIKMPWLFCLCRLMLCDAARRAPYLRETAGPVDHPAHRWLDPVVPAGIGSTLPGWIGNGMLPSPTAVVPRWPIKQWHPASGCRPGWQRTMDQHSGLAESCQPNHVDGPSQARGRRIAGDFSDGLRCDKWSLSHIIIT